MSHWVLCWNVKSESRRNSFKFVLYYVFPQPQYNRLPRRFYWRMRCVYSQTHFWEVNKGSAWCSCFSKGSKIYLFMKRSVYCVYIKMNKQYFNIQLALLASKHLSQSLFQSTAWPKHSASPASSHFLFDDEHLSAWWLWQSLGGWRSLKRPLQDCSQ